MKAHPCNNNKKSHLEVAFCHKKLVAGAGFEPATFGLWVPSLAFPWLMLFLLSQPHRFHRLSLLQSKLILLRVPIHAELVDRVLGWSQYRKWAVATPLSTANAVPVPFRVPLGFALLQGRHRPFHFVSHEHVCITPRNAHSTYGAKPCATVRLDHSSNLSHS